MLGYLIQVYQASLKDVHFTCFFNRYWGSSYILFFQSRLGYWIVCQCFDSILKVSARSGLSFWAQVCMRILLGTKVTVQESMFQ